MSYSDDVTLERRKFLKGSALLAAAVGLAAAMPAAAQEPQGPPSPQPPSDTAAPEKAKPEGEKKSDKLVDEQGREYRVCEICGSNMYLAEKVWTCEQCGFSYEE